MRPNQQLGTPGGRTTSHVFARDRTNCSNGLETSTGFAREIASYFPRDSELTETVPWERAVLVL